MTTRKQLKSRIETIGSDSSENLIGRLFLETQAHVLRVQELALVVYREAFNDCEIITERDVARYIKLHDAPKLMSLSELKRWGYTGSRTFLERLSDHYGMGDSEELRLLADELNQFEQKIKQERLQFFDKDQLRVLAEIERVADVTDTAKNRYEELNFKPVDFGGVKYLKKSGDEHLAPISRVLEINYLS